MVRRSRGKSPGNFYGFGNVEFRRARVGGPHVLSECFVRGLSYATRANFLNGSYRLGLVDLYRSTVYALPQWNIQQKRGKIADVSRINTNRCWCESVLFRSIAVAKFISGGCNPILRALLRLNLDSVRYISENFIAHLMQDWVILWLGKLLIKLIEPPPRKEISTSRFAFTKVPLHYYDCYYYIILLQPVPYFSWTTLVNHPHL